MRLEHMSFEKFVAVLRERASARRESAGEPREGPRAHRAVKRAHEALSVGLRKADTALRPLREAVTATPAYQRVDAAVRKQLAFVTHVTDAVNSSEIVQASWQGVKAHFGLIIAFSAAINLLYLAPSLYMLQVYDRVLPTGGILTLILLSVVLIASLTTMALLDAARTRLLARASLRIERLSASAIIHESITARRNTGQSPTGIRDLDTLRTGVASPGMVGLLDIPWTPLFIIICFVIHFWIGMLSLFGAVVIFGLALLNERATRKSLESLAQAAPRFYAAHDSDLNAAESVHALGAESAITRRRILTRADLVDAQTKSAFDNSGYSAGTKAVRMMLQSAALGLGCYLAVQREISPGAIIASSILTARAFAPVEQIVGGWRQLALALTAFKNLRKVFEDAAADKERTPLPEPAGRIQLEGVAATAPGTRTVALQNVTFQARPGEIIGIIGPSGAGKTTLARVLANAVPPVAGTIRIDGARYADWDIHALSRHIGYLPQRIDLFDGTITDNISCFARAEGEPMETVGPKVVEAAQLAGAHEMILGLPNGYEAMLGLGGAGVSPGQAQRIALARALYGNPRVIVLDEPNSHLDSEGEIALVQALQTAKTRGSVVFIVAHRAGVIGVCDKILVLKEGRVIEFGARNDVMAKLAGPAPTAAPAPRPAIVSQNP